MASAGAGIGESFARFGNELPIVGTGLEVKFQNAEGSGVAQFAVGLWFDEGAVILTACTEDELANAASRIRSGVRSLWGEAFVIVVVTADNDVRVAIVEGLEKRLDGEVVAMGAAGAEERLVPIGQGASGRVCSEIGAKPFFLRRTGFAATNVLTFAIQHNNVPSAEFVAVVAGLRVTGSGAKIVEVRRGAGSVKLVVAGSRAGAGFHAAPSLVVTCEVFLAAIRISKITDGHDRAGNLYEQFCRGFGTGKVLAVGDVTSSDEDSCLIRRRGGRGRNTVPGSERH